MRITILTLFPNMFTGFLSESIVKRAIDKSLVSFKIVDIRDYSSDKHHHVDDTPYGGGAGMIMQVDIVHKAIEANRSPDTKVFLMSPQGEKYTQQKATMLSTYDDIMLVCGHYEGIDERILKYIDGEISIGDYVLTGGELASMVIADSVVRLIKGAIVMESYMDDTFQTGLLEYPQYTRPYEYDGMVVPDVLVNGNHKLINTYRKKESLRKTLLKRPDLLENYAFSKEESELLIEIKKEL